MNGYKAGAASVCITPDEPLWLAGYAVRTAPARGKISDLYTSALALEDETGQRFVIASADVIAITRAIADRVADAVCSRHGLARSQLLLTATHTHYGPEFRADKQVFFNIPDEYAAAFKGIAKKLVAALSQVIDQAITDLEPATLFARKTSASFAHNRRRHGVVDGRPAAEDIIDHDVPVLDCVDALGNHKAIVYGYACHNTTIPPDDLRYCADWAGFANQELQQAFPGVTGLFIPGAGADQDPEPRGSIELSREHGRQIAQAVQETLNAPGIEITGTIRTELEDVKLELEPVTQVRLEKMLESDDPPQRVKARFLLDALDRGEKLITSYPAPVQVVRLGNELIIVALGGEPVVDWAHKFKQGATQRVPGREQGAGILAPRSSLPALSSPLIWVAGYCNDMFGYLPTRRVQSEGGYEGGRSNLWSSIPAPFTDDVEDRITDAVRRLIDCINRQ
ncbi:MAG TPA: neutral/alkaline non-lysosomal ceramidase N-terminal domain-containing protein [Lacipirellulaceae bacterium]|nr:neutral/alkaline non-lysosomal ceramidase N-terminal domain-containing protein [Lacipirellulaceae bacterium]